MAISVFPIRVCEEVMNNASNADGRLDCFKKTKNFFNCGTLGALAGIGGSWQLD
jgi:hypothetical protein